MWLVVILVPINVIRVTISIQILKIVNGIPHVRAQDYQYGTLLQISVRRVLKERFGINLDLFVRKYALFPKNTTHPATVVQTSVTLVTTSTPEPKIVNGIQHVPVQVYQYGTPLLTYAKHVLSIRYGVHLLALYARNNA